MKFCSCHFTFTLYASPTVAPMLPLCIELIGCMCCTPHCITIYQFIHKIETVRSSLASQPWTNGVNHWVLCSRNMFHSANFPWQSLCLNAEYAMCRCNQQVSNLSFYCGLGCLMCAGFSDKERDCEPWKSADDSDKWVVTVFDLNCWSIVIMMMFVLMVQMHWYPLVIVSST